MEGKIVLHVQSNELILVNFIYEAKSASKPDVRLITRSSKVLQWTEACKLATFPCNTESSVSVIWSDKCLWYVVSRNLATK